MPKFDPFVLVNDNFRLILETLASLVPVAAAPSRIGRHDIATKFLHRGNNRPPSPFPNLFVTTVKWGPKKRHGVI